MTTGSDEEAEPLEPVVMNTYPSNTFRYLLMRIVTIELT